MLSEKQNLLETIRGGNPDHFVNQYRYLKLQWGSPYFDHYNGTPCGPGMRNVKDGWGVTWSWPEGMPGAFPVHDEQHLLLKDITQWKKYIHAPEVVYSAGEWEPYVKEAERVDREQYFVASVMWPGIFEQLHNFMDVEETLVNLYEEPEAVMELIDYLTEWELAYADEVCKYIHPDALFHHDDWGSQNSTFMSPAMFERFLYPAYKKIYRRYKENGVQLIVHHSDSYAATLVPYMIDMGIDIWQGVMNSNHIPELIREYGGKISFMGGIDSASVDYPGWTREKLRQEVQKACKDNGKLYFIPSASQGMDDSTFPGVYDVLTEEIDRFSAEYFQ